MIDPVERVIDAKISYSYESYPDKKMQPQATSRHG
jgi:hypothetical protein